jgi:DNA-binding transcriptional MerR regulator
VPDELLTIGEVARLLGVAVSTLRYWEERGLITPVTRRAGKRCYGPAELHRLALIQLWQDTGLLSLDEINAVFDGEDRWRDVLDARLAAIAAHQTKLAAAAAHLEHLLTCPSSDPATNCSLLHEVTRSGLAGDPVSLELLVARAAEEAGVDLKST